MKTAKQIKKEIKDQLPVRYDRAVRHAKKMGLPVPEFAVFCALFNLSGESETPKSKAFSEDRRAISSVPVLADADSLNRSSSEQGLNSNTGSEARESTPVEPSDPGNEHVKVVADHSRGGRKHFDKKAYQREYMKKKRAEGKTSAKKQ
jgi:hypothetical protein